MAADIDRTIRSNCWSAKVYLARGEDHRERAYFNLIDNQVSSET